MTITSQHTSQDSTGPRSTRTDASGTAASARPVRTILPSAKKSRSGRGHALAVVGPPLAVACAVIGIWYLLSYVVLSDTQRFIMPPPHQIVDIGFLEWDNFHAILKALWSTAQVSIIAFALSSLIGLAFAIAMSEAKWVERSFYPFAVMLQTLPFLALVPLVGFWFGFNETSRIIVSTLVSLFPITTNALFGLQSGDASLHDLVRLHNTSRLVRLRTLRLPGALPAIFTGLRISAGLCVIASIVTDFFIRQGQPGIGGLLQTYSSNLQSEQMYASLAVTCALGLLVFWLVGLTRKIAIGRWEPTSGGRSDD